MEFERREIADEMDCYSCQSTLANTTPVFKEETWTATCPVCAVVNKLTPTPDREGHFSVSGAFFVVQKSPAKQPSEDA